MNVLVAMTLAGLGTYLIRISMVVAEDRFGSIGWLQDRLPLVAPAVLGAIVASWLFVDDGQRVSPGVVELVAIAAGVLAVRRSGSVGAALAVGLPIFWVGAALGLA